MRVVYFSVLNLNFWNNNDDDDEQTLCFFLQNESTTDDDDDGDDDDDEEVVTILPEDKYRLGSLEKMISVMAVLVEESRDERWGTTVFSCHGNV